MRSMSAVLLVIAACAGRTGPEPASVEASVAEPSAELDARALGQQAAAAHASGDYATFLALTQQALALGDDPAVRYNLACGQALTGQPEAALESLRALLELRIDYGAAADADFASLHGNPAFEALTEQFEALFPAVHTSTTEVVLQRVDLVPEGVAHHAGRTFVSSMTLGGIYEVARDGSVTEFASVTLEDVPLSVLGLAVDRERNHLWAVGSAFQMAVGYDDSHAGTTAVFGFDLATGEPVAVRRYEGDHPRPGFNDLAVAADGTVYASGTGVHVAHPGEPARALALSEPIEFANGLALTPDETALYAAAGPRGIAHIALPGGDVTWVQRPEDQYIRGFDGLYYTDGRLVGVQHGQGGAWRALQLDLDPSGLVVEQAHVLEQKHPDIRFATTAYVDGESLVVLGGRAVPEGRESEVPQSAGAFGGQPVLERVPLAR